jgi:hypothetical protein
MVGASGVTILFGVTLDLPLAVAAVVGAAFFVTSVALHMRYDRARHVASATHREVRFPSPS